MVRRTAGRDLGQKTQKGLVEEILGLGGVPHGSGQERAQGIRVVLVRGAGGDGLLGDRLPPGAPRAPVTALLPRAIPRSLPYALKGSRVYTENLYFVMLVRVGVP
jgi:hypothetical protein